MGRVVVGHSNQADTVSIGVTLVTPTTTRRGLYVGATRGRDQNQLLVVTDTDDIAEARDVLEGVLASDRADTPAVAQRRDLGAAAHNPLADASTANAVCRRRWVIPDWFAALQHDTRTRLANAVRSEATDALARLELEDRLIAATNALRSADDRYAPYRDAVEGTSEHVDRARRARSEAQHQLRSVGLGRRKQARHQLQLAEHQVDAAEARLKNLTDIAAPFRVERTRAAEDARRARSALSNHDLFARLNDHAGHATVLRDRAAALDTWARWADGLDVEPAELATTVHTLTADWRLDPDGHYRRLADAIQRWARSTGQRLDPPLRGPEVIAPSRGGLSLGR